MQVALQIPLGAVARAVVCAVEIAASRPAALRTLLALCALLLPATSTAGVFTPVAQSRVLTASDHLFVQGFTCWETVGIYQLPGCPETLEDTVTSDAVSAPDFAPFSGTASLAGATVDHGSAIGASQVTVVGTASAEGEAAWYAEPGYEEAGALRTRDRAARDESTITVTLDEATPYLLQASGRLEHSLLAPVLSWDASLLVTLDGPGGEVGRFEVQYDPLCANPDDDSMTCLVEPAPLYQLGTLQPGQYTLTISLLTEADGGWYRFSEASAIALGAYDVALTLDPVVTPVPLLGPLALCGLALALGGVGAAMCRR